MKTFHVLGSAAVAALVFAAPIQATVAENGPAPLDLLRGVYATDREEVVAEALQLTDEEAARFWPLYEKYRLSTEKIGDELVKLVLNYADVYPNVPEDRARQLLKDYISLEKKFVAERSSYLKKFGKVLPASKALRFAQLEQRMDLALRLQLASKIPVVPVEGRFSGTASRAVTFSEGVPGGSLVRTYELVATVTAIDQASRIVTLLSPEGFKQKVKVIPEAVNFAQINIGDLVKFTATEELVVRMAEQGESIGTEAGALVALTSRGAKPGGVMAAAAQATATLSGIDQQNHSVTLQFEDGSSRTVRVREDVDLEKRKVGEKVVFSITEMVALRIQKL